VDNSTLFTTAGNVLYAFDAHGQANCSGTPKVCSPLWTSPMLSVTSLTSPTIANGTVYVGASDGNVYAFDEAGHRNCSGTPTTCSPLWTAATGGIAVSYPPAVSNGVLYTGSDNAKLYAFDAGGQTNCSGTPTICNPLWTAATDGADSIAVSGGVVYVDGITGVGNVNAFDAAGQTNCSGNPKVCNALWTGLGSGQLAVANGVVYAASNNGMVALDAAGTTNCSSVTKICNPLWSAGGSYGPPSVANGVVYASFSNGYVYAFDATGTTGCSGSPTICGPLAVFPADGGTSQVAVVNGTIYAGSSGVFAYNLSEPHNYAPFVVVDLPANGTAPAGTTVSVTARAIGDPAPTVQWYQDGVAVPGATSDTYSFTANPPGAGVYAQFTNTFGTVQTTTEAIFVPG
jgi:outer membrane protein assembly factor BamB